MVLCPHKLSWGEGIHKVRTQVRQKGESDQKRTAIILLTLKCVQGGKACHIFGLFQCTYFMDGPMRLRQSHSLLGVVRSCCV